MERLSYPKRPVTVYLNYGDLLDLKAIADSRGMSDSALIAGLVDKFLDQTRTPLKPLPITTSANLLAVAEEWLTQLPASIREDAMKRVEKRSRELSDSQREGIV
jgi:hypothetical protein